MHVAYNQMSTLLGPTLPTLASASVVKRLDPARVLDLHFAWPSLQASDAFEASLRQLGSLDEATACLAPPMFRAYVRTINTHRYRVFSQPSSSKVGPDVYVAEKVRQSVRVAFDRLLRYLDAPGPTVWFARSQAWSEVLGWGGYLEVDGDWSTLVSAEKQHAENTLAADEASRPFVLETISTLERLDHRAADLGPDTIGWCLAVSAWYANIADNQAPMQLHEQAKSVLIALATYHRLTNSFIPLVKLLNDAIDMLLGACDSSRATRAVYSLLDGGVLSDQSVRTALHGRGLPRRELDSIADELSYKAETPAKRRKMEKPSTLTAATSGVRSRLFSIILNGTGTTIILEAASHAAPSWAGDVQLAARLRMWSACSRKQEAKPVDQKYAITALANKDTILETRLQLVGSTGLRMTDDRHITC